MLYAFHVFAGFAFVFADTDQFLGKLDLFTGYDLWGAGVVNKVYTYIFLVYFTLLAVRLVRFDQRRWWGAAILGIVVYALAASVYLAIDGKLLQPVLSREIGNVVAMGLVTAMVANPDSWANWMKPFLWGAGVAFVVRVIAHFVLARRPVATMLGEELVSFYGTFGIHCGIAVALGVVTAVSMYEQRRWGLMGALIVFTVVSCVVVGSGFRRMAMLRALFMPLVGLFLAYWLRRSVMRGLVIACVLLAPLVGVVGLSLVAFYGRDAAQQRVVSLIHPMHQTVSVDSNAGYLDDWRAFGEVMNRSPWGVGYGNSYGVRRLNDFKNGTGALEDAEPPLHVGCLDLVARTGVYGAVAIAGLVWTIVRAFLRMRGRLPAETAMLAGCCGGIFAIGFLFPVTAPMMSQLKVLASYGIALGFMLQMGVRSIDSIGLAAEGALPQPLRSKSAGPEAKD